MDKKSLSECEICTKFTTPALLEGSSSPTVSPGAVMSAILRPRAKLARIRSV